MQRAQAAHCEAPEQFHHQANAPATAGKGKLLTHKRKKSKQPPKPDADSEGMFLENFAHGSAAIPGEGTA